MDRFSKLAVSLLSVTAPTFTSAVYASETTQNESDNLSSTEVNAAIDNLAEQLEEAYNAAPNVDVEEMARGVMAYASGDAQETTLRRLSRGGRYSTKSHAWKKASALMVKAIMKYAPKKVASLAVKKLANLALPGVGWASVAWWGAQCGWDEFH